MQNYLQIFLKTVSAVKKRVLNLVAPILTGFSKAAGNLKEEIWENVN
jgi:hypothetical protein